jgi:multisubunit Na+/H+ antiporter MnhF subunit
VSALLLACAAVLAINLALGLVRLARAPEPVDRLAATQLVATVGIAQLLLLAEVGEDSSLVLVALVLALLGAVSIATFLRVVPIDPERAPR